MCLLCGIPYRLHPIEQTPSMYLDYVLLWPDDGCFTAETCCL